MSFNQKTISNRKTGQCPPFESLRTLTLTLPSLLNAINSTKSILDDLRNFNKRNWLIKYPCLNHHSLSLSFADNPHLTIQNTSLTSSEFRVFRLDLKLGPTSPTFLVSQLEKSSIANLLDDLFLSAINHIEKLKLRVQDTSSKVLVTGDLNAGKSTFVNALLRREVMPVDQQPCTTAFCEVHDAAENNGKEEVHVLIDDSGEDGGGLGQC